MTEWIEACLTFVDAELSQIDVADQLVDEHIYQEQDFAKERIAEAWRELRRRAQILGEACPYAISGARVESVKAWSQTPAYAFCLMAALHVPYRAAFEKAFKNDYADQGSLLERLTAEALQAIGWNVHVTGWSTSTTNSIAEKVAAIARHLGEASLPDALKKWTSKDAKDAGLDVVGCLAFADGWSGRPLLYIQCASGHNWRGKRSTPNLDMWDKLIDLATRPTRGIAIPFALLADDFRKSANSEKLSLVLDRHRLSAPPTTASWLSSALEADLNKWTARRLAVLLSEKTN